MSFKYTVGIDVSKATLDCSLLQNGHFISHQKIANQQAEIKDWYKALRQQYNINKGNTIFCLEQMGVYDAFLLKILTTKKASIWRESPLQIKRSMGIQRGKNDRLDSLRIAQYAYIHKERFKPYAKPRAIIGQLRQLSNLRSRLQGCIIKLQNGIREKDAFFTGEAADTVDLNCIKSLVALKMDFDSTTAYILELIKGDERLYHLYKIITSVPFVGNVLATELIIITNEYLDMTCPKKFACYCGVVPFERSSGTSLMKRPRVSKLANKKMRALLHIAALSSISKEGELKTYYKRRVNEGYAKMSVINAIRNKLIHRVFACVRDDRMYQLPDKYKRFEPTLYAV